MIPLQMPQWLVVWAKFLGKYIHLQNVLEAWSRKFYLAGLVEEISHFEN